MIGLQDPDVVPPPSFSSTRRPQIITIAIAASILVVAALKYAPAPIAIAPASGQPSRQMTVEDVARKLDEHQAKMVETSTAEQETLKAILKQIERECVVLATNAGIRPETCIQ